jgi:peptidoglycan/xylan/chitin deacetylase (PgdA/CDA1 family)
MRAPAVTLAAALLLVLAAGGARAEIVHDGGGDRGPLDLLAVKVGQHDRSLLVRFKTDSRLPRLRALDRHPHLRGRGRERFVCLNFATPATGRRLLCPGGRISHGGVKVGVSRVAHHEAHRHGSVRAGLVRRDTSLTLRFGLGELGLEPGRLSFYGLSRWYGPACERGRGPATCGDRAPRRGSGRTSIRPLQRVGCTGVPHGEVFSGPRAHKRVALTFDDGPSAYTPEILRILDHHDVHATFFEIGEQVPAYPQYTRAILAQGSELGNHTWRHTLGSSEGMARTSRLIERASGFRPCMFRPPGGQLTASQAAEARRLHMTQVIWDVDTRDWSRPGTGAIISRATAVQPGSIVLMHDGGGPRDQTVAALPHVIANLKSRGFHLVTLTRLLGGHYRVAEGHRRPLPAPQAFPARRPGP